MAKNGFHYQLGERLNVPGLKNTQGVVSLPTQPDHLINAVPPDEDVNWYFLTYLLPSGKPAWRWFSEAELRVANENQASVTTYDPSAVIKTAAAAPAKRRAPTKKSKR